MDATKPPPPHADTPRVIAEARQAAEALRKALDTLRNRCRADKPARAAIREAVAAVREAIRDAEFVADGWDAHESPGQSLPLRDALRELGLA